MQVFEEKRTAPQRQFETDEREKSKLRQQERLGVELKGGITFINYLPPSCLFLTNINNIVKEKRCFMVKVETFF